MNATQYALAILLLAGSLADFARGRHLDFSTAPEGFLPGDPAKVVAVEADPPAVMTRGEWYGSAFCATAPYGSPRSAPGYHVGFAPRGPVGAPYHHGASHYGAGAAHHGGPR